MGTRTDESELQPSEMHTLRRQLDEQLAESLSQMSECSKLRSQVQETWSDEIIKVTNGEASDRRRREVLSESEQSIRPGKMKETDKAHQ